MNREFEELLEAFENGTLTPEDEKRLQKILESCEDCRKEYEARQTLHRWLKEAPRVPAPPGFRTAILRQIQGRKRSQHGFRWVPALAPALLALLVVFAGWWIAQVRPRPLEATPVTVDLLTPEPQAALLTSDFLIVGALYPPVPYEVEVRVDSVEVPYRNVGGTGYFVLKDLPVGPGYHEVTVEVRLPTLHQKRVFHREVYLVNPGGDAS